MWIPITSILLIATAVVVWFRWKKLSRMNLSLAGSLKLSKPTLFASLLLIIWAFQLELLYRFEYGRMYDETVAVMYDYHQRSLLSLLLLLLAFAAWSKVIFERWSRFSQHPNVTPLQACYRCLIPFYNLYWIHVVTSGWTIALREHIEEKSQSNSFDDDENTPLPSMGLSIALAVLINVFLIFQVFSMVLEITFVSLQWEYEEMLWSILPNEWEFGWFPHRDDSLLPFAFILSLIVIGAMEAVINEGIIRICAAKGLIEYSDTTSVSEHPKHRAMRIACGLSLISLMAVALEESDPTHVNLMMLFLPVLFLTFWVNLALYRWKSFPETIDESKPQHSAYALVIPFLQFYGMYVATVHWRKQVQEYRNKQSEVSSESQSTPIQYGLAWVLTIVFSLYFLIVAYSAWAGLFISENETPWRILGDLLLNPLGIGYDGDMLLFFGLPIALLIVGWFEAIQAEQILSEHPELISSDEEELETVSIDTPAALTPAVEDEPEPVVEQPPKPEIAPTQPIEKTIIPSKITLGDLTNQVKFGVGGMAEIFLADQPSAGRKVIIKQAHEEHVPLHLAVTRLKAEGELMRSIDHYRIPTFIDDEEFTRDDGRSSYRIIMEYIEGGDLKETMGHIIKVGLQLPMARIIEYLEAICEPLIQLASLPEPIYHRDLKPHNVILHPKRGPVVIDWGLAKLVQAGSDVSVTRGGSGTWTAPERDSGVNGPFTDVYSLGKILYYLATSEQPPVILSYVERDRMMAAGHPQWLADLMLRAAWPRHEERLQNVHMFAEGLANEGRIRQSSQDVAASDDFTTWG